MELKAKPQKPINFSVFEAFSFLLDERMALVSHQTTTDLQHNTPNNFLNKKNSEFKNFKLPTLREQKLFLVGKYDKSYMQSTTDQELG